MPDADPGAGASERDSLRPQTDQLEDTARTSSSEATEPSGRDEDQARPCRTPFYAWPLLILSVRPLERPVLQLAVHQSARQTGTTG